MPRIRTDATYFVRLLDLNGKNPKRVEDESTRVVSLAYEDTEATLDKLALTVDNYDLSNFDDPLWAQGNGLEVSWGYGGNMTPARTCTITSVKGASLLTVEAVDKSIAMHKAAQEMTYRALTRSQIVQQVAARNGYGPSQQHIETTSIAYEHEHQARETDAAFLMRLARRQGFQFFVDFDGLHWHQRKLGQAPLRQYIYFTDPGEGDILSWNVENDVTVRPARITLAGRDPITKSDILATGDNKSTERTGLAGVLDVFTSSEPPKAENEPETPEGPIRTVNPITGETGMLIIAHTTEPTAAAAKVVADGHYKKAVLTVDLTVNCVGDPGQVAKSLVTFKGISQRLSGNYYVTKVKHSITGGQYTMAMTCKRDGRSSLPNAPTAQRSDAKQNAQPPKPGGDLEPFKTVDAFGRVTTGYRDTRGRQQGGEGT